MIFKPAKFRSTYRQMRATGYRRVDAVVWAVRTFVWQRRRGDVSDG